MIIWPITGRCRWSKSQSEFENWTGAKCRKRCQRHDWFRLRLRVPAKNERLFVYRIRLVFGLVEEHVCRFNSQNRSYWTFQVLQFSLNVSFRCCMVNGELPSAFLATAPFQDGEKHSWIDKSLWFCRTELDKWQGPLGTMTNNIKRDSYSQTCMKRRDLRSKV